MKKYFKYLLLMILLIVPISVFAEGNINVSPSSLTLEVGETKSFTISAYNIIGDVTISSNNSSIASVNTNSWGTGMVDEKQTKTGTISITGNNVGSTIITIVLDAATFDSEDLAGQTRTVNVNVIAKSQPTPAPTPTPTPTNNNNNNTQTNIKSTNNKLKELKIENQEIKKIDDNNYEVSVGNNVTAITIEATSEDEKATIEGTGEKTLEIGENNFEIIITAENNTQNKINIKVVRKEGLFLEDLKNVINDNNTKDIDITVNNDSVISKEDIELIKNSKKIVTLNYIDQDKKLIYSLIIDGSKIKDTNEFVTNIEFINDKDFSKAANYADGLMIKSSSLIDGLKIKLYVGNKFENDSLVNIYSYNQDQNKVNLEEKNIKVENGYITFNLKSGYKYLLTMSDVNKCDNNITQKKSNNNFVVIIILFVIVIAVILVFIYLMKRKHNNNQTECKKEQEINHNKYNNEYLNNRFNTSVNDIQFDNSKVDTEYINQEINNESKTNYNNSYNNFYGYNQETENNITNESKNDDNNSNNIFFN